MNIQDTLNERAKTHGKYDRHAGCTQALKDIIREWSSGSRERSASMNETLDMIAHKIGRIVAGDPSEPDHWRDIAGYAMLICNQLTADKE